MRYGHDVVLGPMTQRHPAEHVDEVAMITGASTGIGLATVEGLVASGRY